MGRVQLLAEVFAFERILFNVRFFALKTYMYSLP